MNAEKTKEMVELYLEEVVRKRVPNAKIKFKKESRLLKFLRPILSIFNKNYWDGYITTLGSTMYIPDDWYNKNNVLNCLQITAHEAIHMYQAKRQTSFIHGFLYLFPQSLIILAILSFLAIPFSSSWLYCLLFLVCLAPLPAPFRYSKELEAYRIRVLFFKNVYRSSPEVEEWAKGLVVKFLSKTDYYFTWPFPKWIKKDLDKSNHYFNKPQYQEILDFIRKYNLR